MRVLRLLIIISSIIYAPLALAKKVYDVNDSNIVFWNLGNGLITYKFKEATRNAVEEWRESGISEDLIDLNLISIPDIVEDKKFGIISYPLLDLMRINSGYDDFLKSLNINLNKSTRDIWTYEGYDVFNLNNYNEFEFKVSPEIRPYGKYEKTLSKPIIKLGKVSLRVASAIFPDKYKLQDIEDDSLEAKDFWSDVFNSNTPIFFTEGQKKALSLLSHGFVAISIPGTCRAFTASETEGNDVYFNLITDLQKILSTSSSREFYITFDEDSEVILNSLVSSSAFYLAENINNLKSSAKIISLPKDTKGVDDFLVKYNADAYLELVNTAVTPLEYRRGSDDLIYQEFTKIDAGTFNWCFNQSTLLEEFSEYNKRIINNEID
jgi:hypothetical protein